MVKGHYCQLRACLPLFHNFYWFSIKAAPAHHPVIQKEVQELLAKEAIEPLTGDAGFHLQFVCGSYTLRWFRSHS